MLASAAGNLKAEQQCVQQRKVGGRGGGGGGARYLTGCVGSCALGSNSSCQQRLLPDSSSGCLNSSCGSAALNGVGCPNVTTVFGASDMFSPTPTLAGGASSSSSSTTHYPKETMNPPPTPTTRQQPGLGICYNNCYHPLQQSSSSNISSVSRCGGFRGHSYRHYKARNRPPPPTPCSTDICDDSDVNSTTLVTSTPYYSSDTNTIDPEEVQRKHHRHPNSPNPQYCSLSSLPHTEYYWDSEPEPPPPTPLYTSDRGSPAVRLPHTPTGGTSSSREGELLLLGPLTAARSDRYYCPPPPSPEPSD